MATAPGHRFGQIIGDLLEEATIEACRPIAAEHGFYLDYIHPRKARGGAKKVRWDDDKGNHRDLDIVIEENGNESKYGVPRAFIEVAWRRYTKHSKNKAQEISAAVTSCANRFATKSPFKGCVLAGDFTDNALMQLRSEGFSVMHFPTEEVIEAFDAVGIDIIWEEDTPDDELEERVRECEALSSDELNKVKQKLFDLGSDEFGIFVSSLAAALDRRIAEVDVIARYGRTRAFPTVDDACAYIADIPEVSPADIPLLDFAILVRFSDGDTIEAKFKDRNRAINYLISLKP